MTEKPLLIAIDGPSGAGKGTLARAVAATLGYQHVDTGAMYRAVAWRCLHAGIALDDEAGIATLAHGAELDTSGGRVVIDGHEVSREIRTPHMDKAAARVARLPGVRQVLVARQRALGTGKGVVMEGRDIGSVVFPDADVKIYLDASAEERARRRAQDPSHSGQDADLAGVQSQLQARDKSDSERPVAPLTLAKDAVYIDTTGIPIEQVVERVLALVRQKAGA